MLRWIFWILIALWILSKLKFILKTEERKDTNHQSRENNVSHDKANIDKKLKQNAGEYIDYEDLN